MTKEYRVGTDCGSPAILCNGTPISLEEAVTRLNLANAAQQITTIQPKMHPVYFVNGEHDHVSYTSIILCTSANVFDRSVEKIWQKHIKKEHNISGKIFMTTCSLLGHTTIDDANERGLFIA